MGHFISERIRGDPDTQDQRPKRGTWGQTSIWSMKPLLESEHGGINDREGKRPIPRHILYPLVRKLLLILRKIRFAIIQNFYAC